MKMIGVGCSPEEPLAVFPKVASGNKLAATNNRKASALTIVDRIWWCLILVSHARNAEMRFPYVNYHSNMDVS
jgi:hypothetical protein